MSFKWLLIALVFALVAASVSAVDVSDAVSTLENTTDTKVIAASADTTAAQDLTSEFKAETSPTGTPITTPTIIVGGPCANPQWTDIAGDTCEDWSYDPGEAVIIATNTGILGTGDTILLIAGTDAQDTQNAVNYLLEHKNTLAMDTDRVVINVESTTGQASTNQTTTPTGAVTGTGTSSMNKTTDASCLTNSADNTLTVNEPMPGCGSGVTSTNSSTSANSSNMTTTSPFPSY
jgi:hypothetical protein